MRNNKDIIARSGGTDLLLSRSEVKRNIVIISRIHSAVIMPIFSIDENGNDETFSVSSCVKPVRKSRARAIYHEMSLKGNVRETREAVIMTSEETGTIIIFDSMNHVGNLLKSITVNGNVPSWAMTVTAADCHAKSVTWLVKRIFV